jgi:ferric-dicitrate binding protein FerR (iron transport regulator)/outer membrane protein assembly factor BamD (BamD/ComL family)
MNACRNTQSLLFEKADGRLAANARAELDAHLAVCPHCQQTFAAWTSALPRLRNLPENEISAVSLRRMEGEILRDLPGPARPRSRRMLILVLAAGLVLAIGAGLLSMRSATLQPFARLQTLWGKVTLSGVAMSKGAVMGAGGVLEIAAEGEAAFLVGRGAEVRLMGPGRVAFDGTPKAPRLRLDSGRVVVQVAHRDADESFHVTTAHGRVEVKGTRFVVGYGAQGSYVHVDEGEVMAYRQGEAKPWAVGTGSTFSLKQELNKDEPSAPRPLPAMESEAEPEPEPRACAKSTCANESARARKAMRAGNSMRAIAIVEETMGKFENCAPTSRCLDELGYLRAEALRQAGRLDSAVTAFKSLNRAGATRAMRQNALYAAAQLERKLGRSEDARQSLERAYAAYPDGALSEEALAEHLELVENGGADARAVAERYLARFPQGMAAARARRILSGPPSVRPR